EGTGGPPPAASRIPVCCLGMTEKLCQVSRQGSPCLLSPGRCCTPTRSIGPLSFPNRRYNHPRPRTGRGWPRWLLAVCSQRRQADGVACFQHASPAACCCWCWAVVFVFEMGRVGGGR